MSKMKTRAMSLLMVMVMVFSMCTPAFAANGKVNVTFADNSTTTLVNTSDIVLHEIGATDVDSVTVSDGTNTDTYTDFSKTISQTLAGGTRYQMLVLTAKDGTRALHFKLQNTLNDTINIAVKSKDVVYTAHANSGAYGQNGNRGGLGTCTMTGSAETTIPGGGAYEVTFTPNNGQEISKLNLRVGAEDGTGKIVDAVSGTTTVEGQTFAVHANADGTINVRANKVVNNLYITALTRDESKFFDLDVSTDGHSSADVTHESIREGSTKTVTFTPSKGYTVTELNITDGSSTGTLVLNANSVRVNGKTYSVTRKLDGTTILTVPAMNANVTVKAVAASDVHFVQVETAAHVGCVRYGTNYVKDGSSFEFYYTPEKETYIQSITLESESLGRRTFLVNDNNIVWAETGEWYYNNGSWFNGTYWEQNPWNNTRIYFDNFGQLHVYFAHLAESVKVSITARTTSYTVTVRNDAGVRVDNTAYTVADGNAFTMKFYPAAANTKVRYLTINYGSASANVDLNRNGSVRIGNALWSYNTATDGTVTLNASTITDSATITASSTGIQSNGRWITTSPDAHSTITHTNENPYFWNDAVTVRITAANGYSLSNISFQLGTQVVNVKPVESSFVLNGKTYSVNWASTDDCSVYFPVVPGYLTITSTTIADTPTTPTNPSTPSSDYYHPAYMVGVGNGMFAPNEALTRAEAVTLLNRAILRMGDNMTDSYKTMGYFADINGHWSAGAVNYSGSMGYLSVLAAPGAAFRPNAPITRAEYLALLCVCSGVDVSATDTAPLYTDVPAAHWAAKYINYATAQGWVNGTGDNQFQPDRSVTRAEICKMTNHILGRTADPAAVAAEGPTFNDVPVTHWAYNDIFEASHAHYAQTANGYETWKVA